MNHAPITFSWVYLCHKATLLALKQNPRVEFLELTEQEQRTKKCSFCDMPAVIKIQRIRLSRRGVKPCG